MDNFKVSIQSIARIKKKQWISLGVIVTIVVMACWGVFSLVANNNPVNPASHDKTALVNMTNPLTHVNESSVWVERTQNALANSLKTTESLQQQLQLLNQAKSEQEKS